MGDTFGGGESSEKPVHEVCVDGFYMAKYEVIQGEYQKITGNNPSNYKDGDQYPVEQLTWEDAQAFIEKLNRSSGKQFRLPTEAEWEYAARSGGKKEQYAGSDSPDAVAWYDSNSSNSTHRVGTKAAIFCWTYPFSSLFFLGGGQKNYGGKGLLHLSHR